jgi:hypothetical protein
MLIAQAGACFTADMTADADGSSTGWSAADVNGAAVAAAGLTDGATGFACRCFGGWAVG